MEQRYPWYRVVADGEGLVQGDCVNDCPIIIPPVNMPQDAQGVVDVRIVTYHVIIMSQSCDLEQGKLDMVLVCPLWSLSEFAQRNAYYQGRSGKEGLRRGYSPGYHLLNRCEIVGYETDYLIVDFRNVYGVPWEFVRAFVGGTQRVRLLPPYREHLSQAFARFFMRVGLPVDIPAFS